MSGVGLGMMISNMLAKKLSENKLNRDEEGLTVFSEGIGKGSQFSFLIYDHNVG
jgi:hypothetical protein